MNRMQVMHYILSAKFLFVRFHNSCGPGEASTPKTSATSASNKKVAHSGAPASALRKHNMRDSSSGAGASATKVQHISLYFLPLTEPYLTWQGNKRRRGSEEEEEEELEEDHGSEDDGGEVLDSTPSFKHRQRQRRRTGGGGKWEHRNEKVDGVSLVKKVKLNMLSPYNMFDSTFYTEKNPIRFGSTPKGRVDGFPSVPWCRNVPAADPGMFRSLTKCKIPS